MVDQIISKFIWNVKLRRNNIWRHQSELNEILKSNLNHLEKSCRREEKRWNPFLAMTNITWVMVIQRNLSVLSEPWYSFLKNYDYDFLFLATILAHLR